MFLPSNITLQFGDSGDFVAELQRRLALVRCFDGAAVNGFYDGVTVNSVTRFQGMHGLAADGVAGPETLRRLNGVIAGDSGSGGDAAKPEEENKQVAATAQHQNILDDMQQAMQREQEQLAADAHKASRETSPPAAAPPTEPVSPMAAAPEPASSAQMVAQAASQAAQADAMQQAQRKPAPSPEEDLEDLRRLAELLISGIAHPVPEPAQQALQPRPGPDAATVENASARQAGEATEAPVAQEKPSSRRMGLVQRTVRFTNAFMQKLADYFESRLAPSVLEEVRQIGVAMRQQGVKDAPMPAVPSAQPSQEQQIPSREQQQPLRG